MGLLFNKIIPMEMLAQMPLPFVHRLRDIRIKQLQEAQQQSHGGSNGNPTILPNALAAQQYAIENLVDELS